MTTRIGINGFGRIGRLVLRRLVSCCDSSSVEVAAINDITDAHTLAHLLKYDSVHGRANWDVSPTDNSIKINGREIKVLCERDPRALPWKSMGVDIVLECTGIFRKREQAAAHLEAGAKKVIISAPSPDADFILAYGVNNDGYNPSSHAVVSCASCTTNCLAPVAKVLLENFGIVRGVMTTIHAYTNDQRILDLPHKDLRRARAAAVNMIPTTTGAAKAVGKVLPQLNGKVDGMAVRVPVSDVSLVDFVCELEREASAEEINRALKNASENALQGVLAVSEEPLVSIDYVGNSHSSIVDSLATMVMEEKLAKVVSWYDNEAGFSCRMVDTLHMMIKRM